MAKSSLLRNRAGGAHFRCSGAAIAMTGGAARVSSTQIVNNSIANCKTARGGALFLLSKAEMRLEQVTITGNSAVNGSDTAGGGGLQPRTGPRSFSPTRSSLGISWRTGARKPVAVLSAS